MTWQEIKSKYELGSIYNLQVENILTDAQLVLFKIEGYDCRLHVSNIANERELSQKLFSVIKEGDIVSVAITDFNDEKQYINLSTKVFRTYLDDVLSFTRSRMIIENELEEHMSLPDRYLRMHRNMLDRLRGDLSSNELTFLYELIQNAVDHPNKNFNNVSITFEIFNNYLLVKHNGSLFTKNNFKSITGILAGEQVNESERERIGYKGIGFKSIFRYTHNVYIRSGNFSFSFKKAENRADLPWEVLPIFQLEKDKVDEIQQFDFFNVPVAFAIELISDELKNDVIKYLKQLSQNPYLLIFLENLVSLEIKIPNEIILLEKEIEKQKNFDLLTLKSNNNQHGKYLTYSKEYEITNPDVIAELSDENITAIPSKMRNFRKPKISLALPLNQNSELINLFTYLPLSNTKYGLPYIINADFIPDLDRTDLVHNLKYNAEVLKFASETLLSFSQLLISEGRFSDFLKFVPDFKNTNINALKIICEEYIKGSDDIELPSLHDNIIKKENLVIDKTGIFKIIDEKFLNELEKFRNKKILSPIVNDEENKLQFCLDIGVFDDDNLLELLSLNSFQQNYFADLKSLIFFLFKVRHLNSSKKIYSLLKTKIKPLRLDDNYFYVSDITLNIEEVYKDMFKYLDLHVPASIEFEKDLNKYEKIKSLFDILSIGNYNAEFTIDLIAKNIKAIVNKLSILENDDDEAIITKKSTLSNLWFFLYNNKHTTDYRNNFLINNQFAELLIECNDGQLEVLKDSILMKEDNTREDYSFLNERYGVKETNYVNVDKICNEYKIPKNEFKNLIKQIVDIEITESRLFNKTLRKIASNDFIVIKESSNEDIVKSFISIFNFFNKVESFDLNRDKLLYFPMLSSDNTIEIPANHSLFISNLYSKYIKDVDFYSNKLFKEIENVKYISDKYIEILDQKYHYAFYEFLLNFNITPGIKIIHTNQKKELLNYAFSTGKYIVKDDFYYIAYFSLINDKYDNLILFWNKILEIKNFNNLLKKVKTGQTALPLVESPFVLYLNHPRFKFFPIKSGICVSINDVYSPDLGVYLKNNTKELTFDINEFSNLKNCLNFKNTLDSEDIIVAMNSNNSYESIEYQDLIINHFSISDFSDEQIDVIKNSIKFKCNDNEFRKIDDTIYLDISLESLPISLISKSNDLYKISLDNLDYNKSFKHKLNSLGVIILEASNLMWQYVKDDYDIQPTVENIKKSIIDYLNDKIINYDLSKIEEFFEKYEFIQCKSIELKFENYLSFSESLLFYKDEEKSQLLFSDEVVLIDILCEEFSFKNSEKIHIRKIINKNKLETNLNNHYTDNNQNNSTFETNAIFSDVEIETLKKIIGGELTEELTSQLEANFSASLKGVLNLDTIGFFPSNPEEFRETNVKCFKNQKGEIRNIIFRSSVKGLLYLDPYSWKKLEDDNIEIWIYLGNENFKIVYTKDDLLNLPYNPYTLVRIDNSNKDVELVNKLMENAPVNTTKLLFITNQEMAEKLNTDIFNNENNQITKNSNIGDENYL